MHVHTPDSDEFPVVLNILPGPGSYGKDGWSIGDINCTELTIRNQRIKNTRLDGSRQAIKQIVTSVKRGHL